MNVAYVDVATVTALLNVIFPSVDMAVTVVPSTTALPETDAPTTTTPIDDDAKVRDAVAVSDFEFWLKVRVVTPLTVATEVTVVDELMYVPPPSVTVHPAKMSDASTPDGDEESVEMVTVVTPDVVVTAPENVNVAREICVEDTILPVIVNWTSFM